MTKKVLLIGGAGYIGSFLYSKLLDASCNVEVCDYQRRGNPLGLDLINLDYAQLSESELNKFDIVLWFAGHSSVGMSSTDPEGAIKNNCLNLFSLASKLPLKTKLIYASSASLYSKKEVLKTPSAEDSLITIPAQNSYDISKFAFDYIAKGFLKNFYGLRMGTLSGYSPNLRSELVFNAMNISAKNNKVVFLKNSDSFRTILFLQDLWILIRELMFSDYPPGFINVGSLNCSMKQLAYQIANVWGAEVIDQGSSETYSFLLDTSLMKNICNNNLITRDFSVACEELFINMESSNVEL